MEMTIDRIEVGIAVLIGREDESVRLKIPAAHLPPGCREGDIIRMTLQPDPEATARARERVGALQDRLRKGS